MRLQCKLLKRTAGMRLLTTVPPYLSSFEYTKAWPTEDKAVLVGCLARTAFTLRLAFLSYLSMTCVEQAGKRQDTIPETHHVKL